MQDSKTRSVSEKFFNKPSIVENERSLEFPSTINEHDSDNEEDIQVVNETHMKEIVYLDQDFLSMNFGDFIDTDNTYTIHIGIYRINRDSTLPFIEFLLDTSGETACFPNILNFHCPNISGDTTDHTHFMNECLEQIFDILPNLNIKNLVYKGYQEDQDQEDTTHNIFVIFEYITSTTGIELPTTLSWAILDEIMYRKQYKNKPIESLITNFFIKNPYMTNIHFAGDNTQLPFPFLGYLCKDNLYNVENCESILDTTYNHPWLGDYHYFSSFPLENNNKILQRYAIFPIEPAKYLWKDISIIPQEQQDEFTKKIQDIDVITLYFHENNIQYWCIRNVANIIRL